MKRRIGEILIANGLITRKILEEALVHQRLSGGNITQYLVERGHLKEEDLAKCISIQFGYPYLPLRAYDVPIPITKMVPLEIVKKHWLMPIDKIENILTLVMSDPFDEDAINEVEKATGCKVQPFVGILSDILKAIEKYYGVSVGCEELKKTRESAPLFITEEQYAGLERRRSFRVPVKIEVHFPLQDEYRISETKNVSMHGFLFESPNMLPLGSIIIMDVDLPKKVSLYPIPATVKVTRTLQLPRGGFDVGVDILRIEGEDLEKIMKYVLSQQNTKA